MRLSDIEGQETAVRALISSIQRSFVAHAYLFAGPRGVGKMSAALAFASALNCSNPSPEGDACGLCISCLRIQAGSDADVRTIFPDGNQTKIEQVQEIIHDLNFAPLSGKYRVFIIEQADTLNPSSENCILKILEEPPSFGVLILVSSNPNSLLPTIRSRCRLVRFRRARTEEVAAALEKRADLPEDDLRVIASCAQGAIGRALDTASDPDYLEERAALIEAMNMLAGGPPVLALRIAEAFRAVAKPSKNDPDERTMVGGLSDLLEQVLSWYSDLLAVKVEGEGAAVINLDHRDDLDEIADRYSLNRIRKALRTIMETRRYLEGNITPQLALECMFFDLQPDLS